MSVDRPRVDPEWAWSPYQPSPEQPWDRRRAAHLYRRAGFAATTRELNEAVAADPQAVVRQLLRAAAPAEMERDFELLSESMVATGKPENLQPAWLYRMLTSPAQHLEKLTLFWHGHFATSGEKVTDARLMLNQNSTLRRLAGGRFEDLAQAISRDPAMLLYLDSATNRKAHPNENYARELMELFCLGIGAYSEQDVRQLARSLTGWEVRQGASRFNPSQYDPGEKTLLGRTGKFDLRPAVSLVCEQPAASRFLARKLAQFFVADEPLASDELIEPLARQLREQDLQIAPLVERIVSSRLFFSDQALQRKVRSPVELGVGTLRALEATTDLYVLGKELAALGQSVFFPPSVKGWDGGRAWINSATLLGRTNLIGRLIHHPQTRFAGGDLESLALRQHCQGPEDWVAWLVDLLAPAPIPPEVQERLTALARQPAASRSEQIGRLVQAIGALPEFQIS